MSKYLHPIRAARKGKGMNFSLADGGDEFSFPFFAIFVHCRPGVGAAPTDGVGFVGV